MLFSKSKVVDKMRKKFLNKKQTSFNNKLARSFIASGITAAPALSHLAAFTLITSCINVFLIEIEVKLDPEKIAASCPGKDTLNEILDTEGVNTLVLMRSRMKNKKKFFSCDGANKGIRHIVKRSLFGGTTK